jgi:NAT, N-acetyltransferase, of N-acetylglutamate synthase
MEPEIIQRFLESVGAKADIDLYLKLFRAQRKESFAILVPNAQIVKGALDPVHFDLRILADLGLIPVVLLGLLEPKDADAQAQRVADWLIEDHVRCEIVRADPEMNAEAIMSIRAVIARGAIPLVSVEAAAPQTVDLRFRLLARMAEALESRRVVFLSRRAGLEVNGGGKPPSVVSLATDVERLLAPGALSRGQALLLRQVKRLLEQVHHRMNVTVVNPLQLLRELFTVNGAGTLIRRGSRVAVHDGWANADHGRLSALFSSAFGRTIRDDFFDRTVVRTYIEESYLGAAVVEPTPVAPYLSKFAVERTAQGEGLGSEIWSLVTRDFPTFYWRSRPENPITAWYGKNCDGLARLPNWHIFWRGLPPDLIPAAIKHALSLPSDFVG